MSEILYHRIEYKASLLCTRGDHYSIGYETIKGFVSVLTYDTLVWRPDESVAIDLS